jgi:general stress protein 26
MMRIQNIFQGGVHVAKIMVPHSNEKEKTILKKFNVSMIDSIDEKAFEKVIIDYLDQHNVLHLATCRDNEPRATPLEYYNNGLTVYISSEGGGKFANLKVNSKVSYSICDPYAPAEDFFGAIGLQVWGTAATFKKNDDIKKYEEIRKYSRNVDALKKQGLEQAASAFNFNVITIEPLKIRYLNLKKGFRNVTWERGE